MANNDFWTSANVEPKRKYRFLVQFSGAALGQLWFAKTVKKPEISVTNIEHSFLNHKFYFPGTVEWASVTIDLVDPVSPDAAGEMAQILSHSGYPATGPRQLNPDQPDPPQTMSKLKATSALGQVRISQINSNGKIVEEWTLNNAFIVKVAYGELAYGDDELSVISLEIRYDWATLDDATGRTFWPA